MVVATPPPRSLGSLKTIESNRDSEEERENENNKIKYVTGLWILIIFPTAPGWSFPLFAHFGHEYSSFFPSRIGLSSCFSCCGGERTVSSNEINLKCEVFLFCFHIFWNIFIFLETAFFFLNFNTEIPPNPPFYVKEKTKNPTDIPEPSPKNAPRNGGLSVAVSWPVPSPTVFGQKCHRTRREKHDPAQTSWNGQLSGPGSTWHGFGAAWLGFFMDSIKRKHFSWLHSRLQLFLAEPAWEHLRLFWIPGNVVRPNHTTNWNRFSGEEEEEDSGGMCPRHSALSSYLMHLVFRHRGVLFKVQIFRQVFHANYKKIFFWLIFKFRKIRNKKKIQNHIFSISPPQKLQSQH